MIDGSPPDPSPAAPLTLRRIRWWRRLTLGTFVALPATLVLAGGLAAVGGSWWTLLLPAALAVLFGLGWSRLSGVRCPRCGEDFELPERLLAHSRATPPRRARARDGRACRGCGVRLLL